LRDLTPAGEELMGLVMMKKGRRERKKEEKREKANKKFKKKKGKNYIQISYLCV